MKNACKLQAFFLRLRERYESLGGGEGRLYNKGMATATNKNTSTTSTNRSLKNSGVSGNLG